MLTIRPLLTAVLLVTIASTAFAQDKVLMETDWLEFVKGHKGNAVGAEVREADRDATTGGTRLVIAIPKVAMDDPTMMEEVRVVGQAPKEIDLLPDYEYEWVDDYDNDYYGLIIKFSEDTEYPIRLFVESNSGFIR
ncbi:MAG: hypothetical protein ABJ084_06965 [Halioglobus sp.]